MIARHGTAHHVEKLVSKYRRCERLQDPENADRQHERRELYCGFDDDGSVIIRGRLPAEQGALVMKALELAMDRADNVPDDVTAETPETSGREPFHARRADALAGIAEPISTANPATTPPRTATRSCSTLPRKHWTRSRRHRGRRSRVPPRGRTRTLPRKQPGVLPATPRSCGFVEDEDGEPLSIGRKSRTIPPAIRRALRARDDGCRFPGCTHRSFLDGHHIEHWADGGETGLDNLVQLCRHHHRLVHEGGFQCGKDEQGKLQFRDPRERVLNRYVLPTPVPDDATIEDWMVSHMQDVAIDDTTCIPNWMAGDTMDWDLAVGNLFRA